MIDAINSSHALSRLVKNTRRQLSAVYNIFLSAVITFFLSFISSDTLLAAEDTVRGTTAASMPHPELNPMGVDVGGYTLFPSLIYRGMFDDNVFATDSNKKSAYTSEFNPVIAANSSWGRHALNFRASSEIGINHTFPSEDYVDWDVNTDGSLDVSHDINLFAGAGIGRDHVPRTAPNDVRGTEPTRFDKASFFTRYSQKFGRINSRINLNILRKEYRDVPAIRLGVPIIIDNSDRDRTQYRLSVRGGYRNVGDEELFMQLQYFQRDYDRLQDFTQLERSSTGLEATVGASFDFSGILHGQLSIGYRSQDYQDPLPDINTPVARALINWNITDLTTVSLDVDRTVQETIDPLFSGYISTTSILNMDHELKRNLVLNLSLYFRDDDYVGISPAKRNDRTYDVITGSTYKMNQNLHLSLQYHYMQRVSEANASITDSTRFDFIKNLIFFSITAQI